MPDLEHYLGREQGFVKHSLIDKYLEKFAIKIGSKWDRIAYLDAFAGPWENQAQDYSDTSFCIALKRLRSGLQVVAEKHGRAVHLEAYLIEKNGKAFEKLRSFAEAQTGPGFGVSCFRGAFEERAAEVAPALKARKTFVFALVDPKGWAGLSMEVIAPLVSHRSAEILVNVMTSFIGRFADVEQCSDSYSSFFGRKGVREVIGRTPAPERQDAVVREYCRSLREICGFKHVSSCVVLQPDKTGIKYFMVFGTNSPVGIKVFKEAEAHAASLQDEVKYSKEFGDQRPLFGADAFSPTTLNLRTKYRELAFRRVEEHMRGRTEAPYKDVFCQAMAMPLVTEAELIEFLASHSSFQLKLDGSRRKKPNIQNPKDKVVVIS